MAAILTGPIATISSLLTEETEKKYPSTEWIFFLNNILMLLAFLGIYLYQVETRGIWG